MCVKPPDGSVEPALTRGACSGRGWARADDNATFLCERLHAEAPSDESVGHLSACYLRQGRPKRAYALLQGAPPSSPHNRYLLALACFKLNKLHEAEGALLHDRRLRTRGPLKSQAQLLAKARAAGRLVPPRRPLRTRALSHVRPVRQPSPVPHGAAGLHLLGAICQRANRRKQAIEYYELSLKVRAPACARSRARMRSERALRFSSIR